MKGGKQPVHIKNKKAYFDYEVLEDFEAGIVLLGPEVKALRLGNANLKGNFVHEWHGQLYVEGLHISQYKYASQVLIEPKRKRKLLLKKKEIINIHSQIQQKGISAVVLELYFKNNLVKAKIGVVRGKKTHDKREILKRKDEQRRLDKTLKAFGKS